MVMRDPGPDQEPDLEIDQPVHDWGQQHHKEDHAKINNNGTDQGPPANLWSTSFASPLLVPGSSGLPPFTEKDRRQSPSLSFPSSSSSSGSPSLDLSLITDCMAPWPTGLLCPGIPTAPSDLAAPSIPPVSPLFSLSPVPPWPAIPALSSAGTRFWWICFQLLPSLLYWIITFTTITLPTWLFTFLSMSLTVTMNVTTLLLICLVIISTITWFIRYRYLTVYSRLLAEPQRKESQIDLFPGTQEGDSKPGLATYLDEFLSAIKVFGYLERPVFHELTRTMQTRKLIAGETLLLEEEKGFCLVVDGLVQIFVKSIHSPTGDVMSGRPGSPFGSSDEDESQRIEGHQGYQLLTEVKNGASMSSLFSILSLFTEDIQLRRTADDDDSSQSFPNRMSESGLASPHGNLRRPRDRELAEISAASGHNDSSTEMLPTVPLLSLEDHPSTPPPTKDRATPSSYRRKESVHPDILARALVDTTIAIIPAGAFRRLTRVYPRASAHIIQVILTRLQRVTFSTAHAYLGLKTEVLQIEKQMNRFTAIDLVNDLRGTALDRLKTKFTQERDRLGPEDGAKGIALHNPSAGRQRRSSSFLRKEAALHSKIAASPKQAASEADPDPSAISPGDLLSTIQLSRFGSQPGTSALRTSLRAPTGSAPLSPPDSGTPLVERSPFLPSALHLHHSPFHHTDRLDVDGLFRESILDCMMKGIGLTASVRDPLPRSHHSEEPSPRLVSYDSRRQKAVFNNAFGLIDPYDDGDTESMMSVSVVSGGGTPPISNLKEELRSEIEIVFFPQGSVLIEQGERSPGLYYVIDGFLNVGIPINERGEDSAGLPKSNRSQPHEDFLPPLRRTTAATGPSQIALAADLKRRRRPLRRSLYLIKPGGMQGYVGAVASYRSFTDVTAETDVYVGFLPRASLERIAERYPIVLLTLAKRLTSILPRLILHIDFALEWVQVRAGQILHHQGDESDAIYIVLNGRLRSIMEQSNGNLKVLGEYGQGESVGELEVMTESTRPATLHAIRDTELAKFPRSLFNSLAQEHPSVTIQISKLIAQRMRDLVDIPLPDKGAALPNTGGVKIASSTVNLRTVAILPVAVGVPVVEFGNRLLNAFHQIGVTNGATSLNQAAILNHLGRHAFSKMGKLKLSQYLTDLEEKYGMVLYIADTSVSAPWTQTCITQADCVLLVGLAEGSPAIGEYERLLLGMKTTAWKELVLLHADRYCPPGVTSRWLRSRMWINGGHHHIQMGFRLTAEPAHPQIKRFGTALKQRVQVLQAEIQKYTSRRIRHAPLYSSQTPFKGDFHRLARRLCGKSVGLVLGGGGARGIAHVGVIKALEEAGIPIDIIGGTSIGAFIGALYARDADAVPMYGRAKKFAARMGSIWRFALDLTYPSVSYTTGHEFNRGIFKAFGDGQIEDFWLEFYCNTTNISKSRNEFHSSGYVWRYIRASMSLAGLLPPLCDDGNMLVDGGYLDNLTVAHMRSLGADAIFAVDVGSLDDQTPQTYGDTLSGFWALLNRWNPLSASPNPLTLSEIQARLAYVSSVDNLERAKNMPGCLYMRPPIDRYATLDFGKFDEIYEVGYVFGKQFLEQLKDNGGFPVPEETTEEKQLRRTMAPRRASI